MSSSPTDLRAPSGAPDGTGASAVAGTPSPADAAIPAGATDVLMPRMGTSVAEGTLLEWRVAVGDPVTRDQVLCEVSTDKVDVECPAPADGVVAELLVEPGTTVDVGTVIARLRSSGGDPSESGASADGGPVGGEAPADGSAPAGAPSGRDGASSLGSPGNAAPTTDPRAERRDTLRRSSPVAARLAAEHGIDVRALAGSGRGGRVTKRDVLDAVGSPGGAPPAPAAPATLMHTESPYRHDPSIPVAGSADRGAHADLDATTPHPETPATGRPPAPERSAPHAEAASPPPGVPGDLGGTAVPATRMRRAIGAAVRRSLDTAAHCTTVVECDMGAVERERRELGLTALPLVAHAVVRTLQRFPALNATFDGETTVRHGDRVHLGIAVSLGDDGLIAPVIHDAQDLSVEGLARRIKDLATRARAGGLAPDEVRGGTFTLTNPGAAGALMATPVISLPQVAILDLEAIVRRPVVLTAADGTESLAIRSMVHLCMGWDHRALDGLYAARFLTALRTRLEG